MKGKIVLIPFPFTDLTATKLRPALILYEGEKDVVAAFIASRTEKSKTIGIIITEKHSEFKETGLKITSVIKLDKIVTISKNLIIGEIGEIGAKIKKEINRKIVEVYTFQD